jgi:hypothetical protein
MSDPCHRIRIYPYLTESQTCDGLSGELRVCKAASMEMLGRYFCIESFACC